MEKQSTFSVNAIVDGVKLLCEYRVLGYSLAFLRRALKRLIDKDSGKQRSRDGEVCETCLERSTEEKIEIWTSIQTLWSSIIDIGG